MEPGSGTKTVDRAHLVPGTRLGLISGLAVLSVVLVVYIYCLCPTVFVGDAGDFLTAAYTLGVPHPPGYPLYTMLGHLFMKLPIAGGISEPAYRMNLLSALAAWGACVFLFLFLRRVLRTEWAALAGALALAFSRQFWQHAEIAEVYALQSMFLTLMFYLATLYVQERRTGWALLLAFVMGLALSHHYAVLIFYPGILAFIGVNGGLRLRWHVWLLAVYLALMGLVPYAYLPIVKYKTPLGPVQFVKSKEEAARLPREIVASEENPAAYFFNYVTRRFYSFGRKYSLSPAALPEKTTTPMVFKRFLEVTGEDFGAVLFFCIPGWVAVAVSMRRRKRAGEGLTGIPRGPLLMPVLGYVIYFLVVHFYPSGDILGAPLENLAVVVPPLLIPLQVGLAAVIALGLDASSRWIYAYVEKQGVENVVSHPKYRTFSALLFVSAYSLLAVTAWSNAEYCDKSNAVLSYYYTLNVLDSCDPGAILLTTGDETFLFWYAQLCDRSSDPRDPLPGYRKDVWVTNWIHNLSELSMLVNEPAAMKTVTEDFIINSGYYYPDLSNYYGNRPINSTFVAGSFAESEIIMNLDVILKGLTYLFRRPGDVPPVSDHFQPRVHLGGIVLGAAPLAVIDYFDSSAFDTYNWDGLPRFEGSGRNIAQLANSVYVHVNLEPQEMEVLGRYQDSLYRFGIQALLQDTDESAQEALYYLWRTVSLDPTGWFGWKELGDACVTVGDLDGASIAYSQVIELSAHKVDVPPASEGGARAGLANVLLIKHIYEESERQARAALLLDPENRLAQAVLEEIRKAREREAAAAGQPPPASSQADLSGSEDELRPFDTPPASQ